MRVIIVCGPRDYADRKRVFRTLDKLHAEEVIGVVVHGGCKTGADAFASEWAEANGIFNWRCNANWEKHGKAAGPIRNKIMSRVKGVSLCVAFDTDKGSRGTADCVDSCLAQGIEIIRKN